MSIYFVRYKILLEAAQLQNHALYYLYVSTVPVLHTCSVENQVQACDVHHSCVTYVYWQ